MGKGKRRVSRIDFEEWYSASWWKYNKGSYLCGNCHFHRSIGTSETRSLVNYNRNNSIEREHACPNCGIKNWFWVPPKARVPKKGSRKWKQFLIDLNNRKFN